MAPTTPTQTPTAGTDAPTTNSESVSASNATDSTDGTDSTDSAGTTQTAIDDTDIPVSGGSLPVEHNRIFDRTTALLGVNVSAPTVIVVKSAAEIRADTGGAPSPDEGSATRSFSGVMGIGQDDEGEGDDGQSDDGQSDDSSTSDDEGTSEEDVSVAAYVPSAHSVIVNERMTVSGREHTLERTLAHEFVHNVQFHQDAFERLQNELDLNHRYSRDRYLTYVSIVEGAAVYVGESYDDQYLAGDSSTITSPERYRGASSGVKYAIARYYFGGRYLEERFDSPKNVSEVYGDPPRTTEQLLHPEMKASEPLPLSVRVFPGENRTLGQTNTNGELFTRIALGTELNTTRASAAAKGWGADQLVPVVAENRTHNRSFVWSTRWDSPAEADEFETALGDYLAGRANRSVVETSENGSEPVTVWRDDSLTFRTVRVSNETVVLLAGNEAFVRNATISGSNASVSVSSTSATASA